MTKKKYIGKEAVNFVSTDGYNLTLDKKGNEIKKSKAAEINIKEKTKELQNDENFVQKNLDKNILELQKLFDKSIEKGIQYKKDYIFLNEDIDKLINSKENINLSKSYING